MSKLNGRTTTGESDNHKLHHIFNNPEFFKIIKFQKLPWVDHVKCMDDTRMPRRVFEGRREGQKPVGKPRKRWADSVNENNEPLLEFRNYRT